jgi:hydrogenase-4 membrane subunit HyfE
MEVQVLALEKLAILLETGLLVTALLITVTGSVSRVIATYRLQSLLLAIVAGLAALEQLLLGKAGAQFVGLIVLLPLALAAGIRYLLARATALQGTDGRAAGDAGQTDAERVWRDSSEAAVNIRPADVAAFLGLIAIAFLIAYQIAPSGPENREQIGLLVSLALPLTGFYNMVFKRDIISQIVGLLVMDHGLYLAVVKVVAIPVPATLFVISLYFYTLITVAILVFLLPQVRRVTGEIALDEIARRSELKG